VKYILTIVIAIILITTGSVLAQNSIPDLGEVFKDDVVPRIDLLLPQDSLEEMILVGSQGSDHHFLGTMIFDNGEIRDTVERVGLRLRGNTSRGAQKKTFKISINTYEPGRKFYGLEKLNINGEHNDPSIIRSKMAWDILRDMGIPAPRANHVRLYLNRQYVGVYINVEHIDEEFVDSRFGNQSGNLYKCIFPAPLTFISNNPNDYKTEMWGRRPYELKTNTEEDDYSDLANFIEVLNDPEASDFACDLEQIFNVNAYLKVMAFDLLSSNWDGPIFNQNNFYLYHNPASGQFEYIPFDLDNTFGIDWFIGDLATRDIYNWPLDPAERPIYTNLLKEPTFLSRFNHYMSEILATTFNPAQLNPYLDQKLELIESFVAQDPFRSRDYGWDFIDFGDSYEMPLGDHVPYGLKPYIQERYESALAQVNDTPLAPIIEGIQVSFPIPNLPLQFSTEVLDDESIASVQLCYTLSETNPVQCLPMELQTGTITYSISLTDLPDNGKVFYYVQASDNTDMDQRHPFCGFNQVNIQQSNLPLFINEFQAKNSTTISDEAGEYDDWIELYNNGTTAIDLSNIYLTDDLDSPSKWLLPTVNMAPKSYLLIWADEDQEQGPFHCNFKLSAGGEAIGLFQKIENDFLPIDAIQYTEQESDQTLGKIPNGVGAFTSLTPSPNASNETVTTSIASIFNTSIQLTPNPTSTYLSIIIEEDLPNDIVVNISNFQGQTVFNKVLNRYKGTRLIWNSDQPKGIYIVQFLNKGNLVGYQKVVLQ